MENFNAKWISNKDFYNLNVLDVFHKELEPKEINHDEEHKNKHILFRKKVNISQFQKAVVRISADDYYKLYINGKFVTQGPAPAYNFHYYYNEIDVTEFFSEGENTIAVHTYYQGLINRVWVSSDYRHGLVFDLFTDDKKIAESDESWKCAYHTGFKECGKYGYDTQYAECYDASSPETNFYLPDFDDSSWENAIFKTNSDYTLFKQPTEQLSIYDVKPAVVNKTDNGYFIDFGFEAVGYLSFNATGKCGDKIVMYYGEELNDDGTVRWKMRCNCDYRDEFILSGKENDKLNQYDYKAFRYVRIELPQGVTIDQNSIAFTVRHYPFTETKHYTGTNEKLAKIYKLCSDTIKYGTQECFVDCPTREKGQYLGDVTIAGIASLELTGNPAIIKKALENYCESSFICKGLMTVAPASLMQEIADYSLQFPFQVLWVYNYTNDMDFLKQMYPYVMNVYDYFADYRTEKGLLSGVKPKWNLIDWPKNLRDNYDFPEDRPVVDGYHNVINGFYLAMLKHIDEIRSILGIEPTGKTQETENSYTEVFYNKENKVFVDSEGSQHASYHSNVLALFAGAVKDDQTKKSVLKLIEEKKLTRGGVYMAFFALYGLKMYGEKELMEKLMTDDGAWLNMLSEGATTCYEAWGKNQKWNTSLFHPWASAPAILLG